jgi:hypothetical protein
MVSSWGRIPLDNNLPLVKVMADYGCYPIWLIGPEGVGNASPYDLGLRSEICERLNAWATWFDSTLDDDDPLASGFVSLSDEIRFVEEGRKLAVAVAAHLVGRFRVAHRAKGSQHLEFFGG